MKRLILFCATMLATSLSFAQSPPPPNLAPAAAVDSGCEIPPPAVSAAELATLVCDSSTGKWVHRSMLEPSSIGALAQSEPASTPAATGKSVAEAPGASSAADAALAEDEAPPNVGELISGAGKVIDDWGNLGWLAGVIALINMLLLTLRLRPIDIWMTGLDYKWIKPLVATLLGAAMGGFSTFQTGAGVLNSIVAGALAGLTSVGFHQLIDQTRKRTTKTTEAAAGG